MPRRQATGPPESGVVEPEQEGRRLGNLPNDQIRQFQMRRAFEEDLPECLPQIRAMMDEEQRNRNWMAFGIGSVLLLVFLLEAVSKGVEWPVSM